MGHGDFFLRETRGECTALRRSRDRPRTPERIASWVLRIARNRCIDHLRSGDARYVTPIGDDLEDVTRDESTIAESLGSLLRAERALVVLEPDDRALVLLHHVHDVPYAELGYSAGCMGPLCGIMR